jgi:NAD(P)-dependent dehydrogenase (short-subunit alcohol dehydrogenase family)
LKLFGYISLTREIYAHMKARGDGVIINDIGNSGENWDANYIAGSTGNAALMAFTRALGGQSMDFGVRVLGVNPGPVETARMIKINKRRALDM